MIRNNKRILKSKQSNNKAIFKASLSAALLALVMISTQAEAISNVPSNPNLKLDINNPKPVVEIAQALVITPGESRADEQVRVAREQAAAAAKAKASRTVVARDNRTYSLPTNVDLKAVYKAAGTKYNIPWKVLNAVHYVETGCDTSGYKTNASGATGPMQFLPSTWRAWGVDGDGDGVADIHNVIDAIYGAAHYLAVCGGSVDIRQGLYSYNHSTSYVNKVLRVADSIAD